MNRTVASVTVVAWLALAAASRADHVPQHNPPGQGPDPTFPVPFIDICGDQNAACTGVIVFAIMIGPDAGTTIYGTTVEITWTTDGTRDASSVGFAVELSVDGERRHIYVTGSDLGFTTPGPGTFHGELFTDALNGVVDAGFIPDSPTTVEVEFIPDPDCEPPPNDAICGLWGAFENDLPAGVFSGVIFHTVPIDPPPPACPVDWNGDEAVDVFDLLAYLDDWFAAAPAADLDLSAGITVFDLLTYLDGWFAVTGGAPCP
jgi:hypothetical protein